MMKSTGNKTANGTVPRAGTNKFAAIFLKRGKSGSAPSTPPMHRASSLLHGTSQ